MAKIEIKKIKPDYTVELIEEPLKIIGKEEIDLLIGGLDALITDNWGIFGKKFINEHILTSHLMAILKDNKGKFIGFATISKKRLCNRDVYYFEFTVIDKEHQSRGFSQKLNKMLTRKLFLENILKLKFSLEFFVITPNMKVLGSLVKFASFIYPDPRKFDNATKRIPEADETTYKMSKELIKISDNPNRKLNKDGNVLEGSYSTTPWLIYEEKNVPKHKEPLFNEFGEHYLEYSKKAGKEFVVRVIFNIGSLLRSFVK